MKLLAYLVVGCGLVACTASKVPVDEDFSALAGQDEKSDAFSYRMKTVGTLQYGQASSPFNYTKTPRFRAVRFDGAAGDDVDVWVRSTNGDPVAWILDSSFRVLGSNDDADEATLDAHITLTLPPSNAARHYIVMRDYDTRPARFTVELLGGPSDADACTMDMECGSASGVSNGRIGQCNNNTHHCETVVVAGMMCEGLLPPNPHHCPTGYTCEFPPLTLDAPGVCVAN